MRRHLSEFSKSPLGACVPAAPRLASSVRGGAPAFALLPPIVSPSPALGTPCATLASSLQFIAVQYVRSANFALRG